MTITMRTNPRTRRLIAAGVVLAFATAGCGLKQSASDSLGVSGTAGSGSGAGTDTLGVGGTGGTGAVGGTGGTAAGPGGSLTGGNGTGTTGGSGSGAGGPGGGTTSGPTLPGACGVPSGGNTTGISAQYINIGLHAPVSGTGTPFPNKSFQVGAPAFWNAPGHTVCGRKVVVDFQDDQYNPSSARVVCEAMARNRFLVIGGAGTDQIQACATDPALKRSNTPYLSAGVTENGLTSLPNYFALSLTYRQQGELVARNAETNGFAHPAPARGGGKKQWAVVTAAGSNFEGARQGIFAALSARHITYEDIRVNQNVQDYKADATSHGQQLALNGYKTMFVDLAPGYFIFMAGGYYKATSNPSAANWTGPGVTFTEVTVAQLICGGTTKQIDRHAWFLSPVPALDRATSDFKTYYKGSYDDIEWILWGLSAQMWELLKAASGNLTRENFIARTFQGGAPGHAFPPEVYGGKTHFGGTGAWSQRINCNEYQPNQPRRPDTEGSWDTVGTTYLRA